MLPDVPAEFRVVGESGGGGDSRQCVGQMVARGEIAHRQRERRSDVGLERLAATIEPGAVLADVLD
ncbi:MAG: hypothetical protein ACC645_20815 [Pirellulales bacterium]